MYDRGGCIYSAAAAAACIPPDTPHNCYLTPAPPATDGSIPTPLPLVLFSPKTHIYVFLFSQKLWATKQLNFMSIHLPIQVIREEPLLQTLQTFK